MPTLTSLIKNKFVLSLIVLFATVTAYAQYAPNGYYIKKYNVKMTVHEDNSYTVVEDIDCYFKESKHGIFRILPYSATVKRDVSEKQDGSETAIKYYSVDVDHIDVSENFNNEYNADYVEIRIGSADAYVEGDHHYRISYDLSLPADRVPQADIFFQSVLGTGWMCDIKEFLFTVDFDKALPQESLAKLQVFTGELGGHTNERASVLTLCSPDRIAGQRENIGAQQALSLYMPLPEGYFTAKDPWQVDASWICLGIAVALLVLLIICEVFKGNQSVLKVLTVSPPDGMSSAELGTVFDCTVDDSDIISLIPYFASKGYLKINNSGEHPILTKVNELPKDAPDYQKTLFNAFFASGKKFDTGKDTPKSFGKAWESTKKAIEKKYEKKLNDISLSMVCLFAAAVFMAAIAMFFIDCTDLAIVTATMTAGAAGIIGFTAMLASFSGLKRGMVGCLVSSVFVICVGLFVGYWLLFVYDLYLPTEYVVGMLALLAIASAFAGKMAYMTPYRREAMGEILGLEEFIRLSEEPQLKQLQADDERYFYDILPYAVALGMGDVWAKKFANIVVNPNENFQGYTGDNFMNSGNMMSSFYTPGLKSGINAYHDAVAAASTSGSSYSSSSSYSSGGGGYSGGGFGGGGGGSW